MMYFFLVFKCLSLYLPKMIVFLIQCFLNEHDRVGIIDKTIQSHPSPHGSLCTIISFCHFTLTNLVQHLWWLHGPYHLLRAKPALIKENIISNNPCQPRWAPNPKSSLLWMKLQKSNKVNTTERQQKLVRKKAKLNSNWFRRVLGIAGGDFKDAQTHGLTLLFVLEWWNVGRYTYKGVEND